MKSNFYVLTAILMMMIGDNLFAQDCPTITEFPFTETFEDDSPARDCWTQEIISGTEGQDYWMYQAGSNGGNITSAHSGVLNARLYAWVYSDATIVKLISPKMDLTALENPTLSFYYAQEAWGVDQNELKVYYRLSENSDWILLEHYWSNIANWTQETIQLPETSSELQVAFEGINDWGRANVLDDVVIGDEDSPGDDEDCSPSTPTNNYENGNGDLSQLYIANDFSVNAYTDYTISQIKLNVIQHEGINNYSIQFYNSSAYGTPNEVITSYLNLVPDTVTDLYTAENGYVFQEVVFDLPSPLTFQGGADGQKIWMAVSTENTVESNASFWEATSIQNSASFAYYSSDGENWTIVDGNWDGVFTLVGECEETEPSDDYCTPGFWYVTPITNMEFAGIENPSGVEYTNTYEDFTYMTGTVALGETYEITLEGDTDGNFSDYYTAFVDWNQDGYLEGDGEVYELGSLTNSTGDDGLQLVASIEIPTDATLGETRIRILKNNAEFGNDPCTTYQIGQAEDYTLSVVEEELMSIDTEKSTTYVYPNPTTGNVFVQSDLTIKALEVYSLDGRKIDEANKDEIDLSKFPSGTYILKIKYSNGTIASKKIVKN